MHVNTLLKWNKRMAIVYATGVWTMIGTFIFYKYTGRYEDMPVKKEEEVPLPEDKTQLLFLTEHSKVVMVYSKDFVPYTTRIYNFISSFDNPGRDK
ncbi:LOW QUALITY PROTEIN: small integral membrane protein 26-like [Gymnodraco acuticeps]|uniref:LOW QUALITY PROTEIN: small integral membrane protein 26-like n=1 Tax=Gymnodraco acuticeps TaxID=8218 RepID=A0A6P8VRJ2_GYMAC|nr:LOW QUALITY PROTEIN: small integral membrane protein 26-like [Gymnodraco acuticeps]